MPAENKDDKRSKQSVEEFIALAMKRWQMAADAESEWRRLALEDLRFSIGEHWPDKLKTQREKNNRPCLTMNHIGQSVKQVTNNQRQQRPAIQVNPAGSGSTKEVAEVEQGMIRHIEVQSDAEVARDIAFDYALRTGKGFYRLRTVYVDDTGDTEDQEIVVEPIMNPFTVYSDPRSTKPDRSDAKFKFVIEDLTHEEYKAQYPDSSLAALTDMSSVGDKAQEWANKETVRVAEYFYIELERVQGKARIAFRPRLKWAKINAIEILEERELREKYIPIIEVVGDDLIVDGKRHTAGMVRDAKDPSRVYDFQVSAAVEVLALAPKAPFIGWEGQFKDPKWEHANQENYAYLEASPVLLDGQPAPSLPQRNAVEAPIVAIAQMIKQADNDIKASTGLYDASLGERGPEQSGKAILQRKQQGDNANFNYTDNLTRAMRFEGRVLLDMIPIYYDAPRVQRIVRPDGSSDHVGIYNSKAEGMEGFDPKTFPDFQAIKEIYDIGVGRYDIAISVGPSFQTKRQEATAMQLELMKNVPLVQQAAPDIVIRNMDIPGADVIADRVKKLLPPQLQDSEDGSPESRAQVAEAKLQALSQQHDLMVQQLNQAKEIIATKQVENKGKLDIEKMKIDAQITIAEIQTKAQNERERMKWEHEAWIELHGTAHDAAQSAQDHENALEQGQQAAENQANLSAQNAAQAAAAASPPNEQGAS